MPSIEPWQIPRLVRLRCTSTGTVSCSATPRTPKSRKPCTTGNLICLYDGYMGEKSTAASRSWTAAWPLSKPKLGANSSAPGPHHLQHSHLEQVRAPPPDPHAAAIVLTPDLTASWRDISIYQDRHELWEYVAEKTPRRRAHAYSVQSETPERNPPTVGHRSGALQLTIRIYWAIGEVLFLSPRERLCLLTPRLPSSLSSLLFWGYRVCGFLQLFCTPV